MKFDCQTILALTLPVVLAVPPPNFGFPEAPNDTVLAVAFSQRNASYTRVDPGVLFGSEVADVDVPMYGFNLTAYESLRNMTATWIVMMVDPDASYPENPTSRFILHFMQANLTLDDNNPPRFSDSNLLQALPSITLLRNQSVPYIPYNPPRPPTNSSAHRYILYAFKQPSNFQIPASFSGISASNRTRFNLTEFISQADLGTPVAANYFYASNQTTVPARFIAAPGGSYPGGNGNAVTSGDPATSAIASSTSHPSSSTAGGATSTSSPGAAAKITAVGSLVGAGLIGLAALL